MAEVMACRICLTTTGRLWKMFENNLFSVYDCLTGITMSSMDMYPKYVCTVCGVLLQKCDSFRQKCLRTQQLLEYACTQQNQLTEDYIKLLSSDHKTYHQLTVTHRPVITIPTQVAVKLEFESSDDEPISEIKKKVKIDIKPEQIDFDDINDVTNINEINEVADCNDVNDFFDGNDNDGVEDQDENNIRVVCLTKEQQIQEIEARKLSYNYLNSFYKCEYCFKGFLTEATFKNHMSKHDPKSGPHICEICKIRCPDVRSLKSHHIITHAKKYICSLCGHETKSAYKAKEHVQWHRGRKYDCNICGATFSKSTSQLTHLRLRHPSNFTCNICGESFIGEYGLKIHKRKAHRDQKSLEQQSFKCPQCEAQFTSSAALHTHTRDLVDGHCQPCACSYCGENLLTKEALSEHLKKVHQNDEEPIKCTECNRSFVTDRSLAMHYHRVHLGFRLQPKCPERARTTVVCEICGKKCMSNASLVYHQRTHTGEKPYQCTECPKSFSMVQRLQIHSRIHTGERPFKCSHCPKAFKHKAALNRHHRVHTGEKPYQCPHCGKSFSQSNSMKLHVRTVHQKLSTPYPSRGRRKND